MKRHFFLFFACMTIAVTVVAKLNTAEATSQKQNQIFRNDSMQIRQTVGVAIDLLPPLMSAMTGNWGYSAQLWYGYNKYRVRGVIAAFTMPDKLMGNARFTNLKTTATAIIFDYFQIGRAHV